MNDYRSKKSESDFRTLVVCLSIATLVLTLACAAMLGLQEYRAAQLRSRLDTWQKNAAKELDKPLKKLNQRLPTPSENAVDESIERMERAVERIKSR